MIKQNEIEEIIRLINTGFDLELLSFELDIPIEQIQKYKEQLELRRFVKESLKNGKTQIALEKLEQFVENTENSLIEKVMLLKLQAYINKTNLSQEDEKRIEDERTRIGFSRNIDEVLEELKVQIPKRKSSNIRKKEKQRLAEQQLSEEISEENIQEEKGPVEPDYEEAIKRYKAEIAQNPQNVLIKRNLLAFTYSRAGKIEDARNELTDLIEESGNYTAYRQLIHLEKSQSNIDDAKLWAYDGIEKFPDSIALKEQLISIAKIEGDNQEIMNQLKEILNIYPQSEKNKKRLKAVTDKEER